MLNVVQYALKVLEALAKMAYEYGWKPCYKALMAYHKYLANHKHAAMAVMILATIWEVALLLPMWSTGLIFSPVFPFKLAFSVTAMHAFLCYMDA